MTTSPDALWVSSLVVALVTDGVSATGSTVMVAVTRLPPRPASVLLVEAWTLKLPSPKKSAAGVNFRPALACANVMKSPLLIAVVPSFWNSVPLVMPVILKNATAELSAALRETTSPDALWVSSLVVALVTDGVSARSLTVMLMRSLSIFGPPAPVLPLSLVLTVSVSAPWKSRLPV